MSQVITSPYGDQGVVSRLGQKNKAGDPLAMFLIEFGGMVITAYDEIMTYMALRYTRNITQGKADTFPIIGRKRDAVEHEVGTQIIGGSIAHNEVAISVDKILVDSVFEADFDRMLNHFETRSEYASQIGQSLGSETDKRIAIMHILASRMYDSIPVPQGQPTPAYFFKADLKTNASSIEDWAFASRRYHYENDMQADMPTMMVPWQQYLLAARQLGANQLRATDGSGNRVTGTVGDSAGISIKGTNHIPQTNRTTGLAKYQGDFSSVVGHVSKKMAVGTLERQAMKVIVKDQPERLGTLIIGSKLDGHGPLRGECSIEGRTTAKTGSVNSINLAA